MIFQYNQKKVIGKFKDELNSLTMEEFVGVLPKCYSILYLGKVEDNVIEHLDPAEKQTAKGTKKGVKEQFLRHERFTDVLFNLSTLVVKQNVIKSRVHTIGTYHQTRTALTAFDTKRWICDDNIRTLAHGHFKINELENKRALEDINWDDPIDCDTSDCVDFDSDIEIL